MFSPLLLLISVFVVVLFSTVTQFIEFSNATTTAPPSSPKDESFQLDPGWVVMIVAGGLCCIGYAVYYKLKEDDGDDCSCCCCSARRDEKTEVVEKIEDDHKKSPPAPVVPTKRPAAFRPATATATSPPPPMVRHDNLYVVHTPSDRAENQFDEEENRPSSVQVIVVRSDAEVFTMPSPTFFGAKT